MRHDDGTLAYRALMPDDVIACVETLGLRSDGRLLALNSYENRVYQVGQEEGPPVVAKIYRPGRWSDAAILEEHRFAAEAAAAEVPVVAPLVHAGRTLHIHGPFRFAVYPRRGGRAPELDDFAALTRIGRFVARLHAVGAAGRFAHRPQLGDVATGVAAHEWLLDEGVLPSHLRAAYESLCDDLFIAIRAATDRAGPVRGLRLHGDFHPGNVLARDEQVHIVDLDDCGTGPAVQDLWMFLSGDRYEQEPQLAALLAGYTDFRAFDAAELNLVESLRSLRMIGYAAWLARRWDDPAFPAAFPWFGTPRYWEDHVLSLREQLALLQEPPLAWRGD